MKPLIALNVFLIRAWLANGAAPLDDLAPALDMHYVDIVKVFAGRVEVDPETRAKFAAVFNKSVEELFPND